jgi:hypothetical protein
MSLTPHVSDRKKDVDDQADSGPDRDNPITRGKETRVKPDPGDSHLGATEDEVSDTSAPAGEEFKDEPRQG